MRRPVSLAEECVVELFGVLQRARLHHTLDLHRHDVRVEPGALVVYVLDTRPNLRGGCKCEEVGIGV